MRVLLIVFFFALSCSLLRGQTLSIEERTFEHDDQPRPSIQVVVDAPPKFLKKEWANFMKKNYDVKLKGIGFLQNKDMLTAEKAILTPLSTKALDLYTHFSEQGDHTTFNVFAAYGYDMYAGQGRFRDDLIELRTIVYNFLQDLLPKYYEDKTDDAQKQVKKLTDDVDDLTDGIADHAKEIEKLRKEIASMEDELEEKRAELEEAKASLEKALNSAKDITKALKREQDNN